MGGVYPWQQEDEAAAAGARGGGADDDDNDDGAAPAAAAPALRPDEANNQTFDKAASAFFFARCQALGVRLIIVSRWTAYTAAKIDMPPHNTRLHRVVNEGATSLMRATPSLLAPRLHRVG